MAASLWTWGRLQRSDRRCSRHPADAGKSAPACRFDEGVARAGHSAEDLHGATDLLTLPLDGTPHVVDAATASSRIAWQLMVADEDVR
ncbi:MAG: hypothetical protein ABIS84_04260, partial [Arachnia sp.]